MSRRANEVNTVAQYSQAAATILNHLGTGDTNAKLRKAEIYAKLALVAAVERLTTINLDLGNVKVDLDLIPEQRKVEMEDK